MSRALAALALAAATALAPAPAAASAATSATPAGAPQWRLQPEQSRLGFTATLAGGTFEGSFARWTADIAFDPADPSRGRFEVRIATSSADTREAERDAVLHGPEFFDTARHPEARFVVAGLVRDGAGFRGDGSLTLRGVTRPVTIRFRWTPGAAGRATLAGEATLSRLAFGVGQGEWRSTEWLADEVRVTFALRLSR